MRSEYINLEKKSKIKIEKQTNKKKRSIYLAATTKNKMHADLLTFLNNLFSFGMVREFFIKEKVGTQV